MAEKVRENILIVIDMQNDFITGSLGTPEAQEIVPRVREKIAAHQGPILFTQDTHGEDYLSTQEGQLLPVPHCIKGTPGWELEPSVAEFCHGNSIEKSTFGSPALGEELRMRNEWTGFESVELIGLCTDICVIANAMIIKSALPEVPVRVDSSCCAGVSPESHQRALAAMAACQIEII